MKNEPNKTNSAIPVVIIGLVLVGVVVGAYLLYRQSKEVASNNNTNVNSVKPATSRTPQINASTGAAPPNMLGSPTASVTVEEFADFQCPTCGTTHPIMKEIQSTYGSKIRFIFREFPLTMHPKAYDAAVAAEAAGMQGKFWAMQDQLFTNQQTWASPSANHKELWSGYAQKIGINVQQWETDIAGLSAKSRVDQDLQRGKGLNVGSTPSVYVNGELVPFPEMNVPGLRRIIDAELQKSPSNPAPASASSSGQVNSAPSNSNLKPTTSTDSSPASNTPPSKK
ncbi:MAG TPA: thioredoxin domain-containing protein [Pyrinomonadaceae bacterium]|nr:thioredoxin domain-containing protein [Pyrinomonadaceae bacterium]